MSTGRDCNQLGDVTRSTLGHHLRDGEAGGALESCDQLKNGCAISSTQVDGLIAIEVVVITRLDSKCCRMALRQINNMDIITHTSAIDCWIVLTEHIQMGQMAASDSLDVWHQVVRNTLGIFTDLARAVCSNWVEVAQTDG